MQKCSRLLLAAIALTMSACSSSDTFVPADQRVLSVSAVMGPGDLRIDTSKRAIALAGGGTKAAAYAMGVLAAAAKSEEQFRTFDAISSVSGGGYASLFIYSKLILREQLAETDRPEISQFFADCIPHEYREVLPDLSPPLTICADHVSGRSAFKFQQFVRCRQDVLENDCQPSQLSSDRSHYINAAGLIGQTAVAIVPNFIVRSIFDWPYNISPSRRAYSRGIGTTYGLYPLIANASDVNRDIRAVCDGDHFLNCRQTAFSAELAEGTTHLTFAKLKEVTRSKKYPTWIVNATASSSRSIFGWAREGSRNFSRYTLQMTPFGARSGHYGNMSASIAHFDLLDAVTTAAAFFDANQTAWPQPGRLAAAGLMHLAALDWGVDVYNPNLGADARNVHNALPFPLYFLDGAARYLANKEQRNAHAAYIRLLDGGNNDNLGAFSLMEAGMKEIFISDHAQDSNGDLVDLCLLHNEVRKRPIYGAMQPSHKMIIPGLGRFSEHCKLVAPESEPQDTVLNATGTFSALKKESNIISDTKQLQTGPDKVSSRRSYPIREWTHDVLVGCIRKSEHPDTCVETDRQRLAAQLYILKPAMNVKKFRDKYLDTTSDKAKVRSEACSGGEVGLCELAAYLASKYQPGRENEGLGEFPQHSTVGMTFASNSMQYGAYRELARWQMTKAIEMSSENGGFQAAIKRQSAEPIRHRPHHDPR